jgi:hypothetical protein
MPSITINFPNGGGAPVAGGKLTYCCGNYSTDVVPYEPPEIRGRVYQGTPPSDPSAGDPGLIIDSSSWTFPNGVSGAIDGAADQRVRVWLLVNGTVTASDAGFDAITEPSGFASPCPQMGDVIAALARGVVIDEIAPRCYALSLDVRSFGFAEPVASLLEVRALRDDPVELRYDFGDSTDCTAVWNSANRRLQLRVVRSTCGTKLMAKVVLHRVSPKGIPSPLTWFSDDFQLSRGGVFDPVRLPRGPQLGHVHLRAVV